MVSQGLEDQIRIRLRKRRENTAVLGVAKDVAKLARGMVRRSGDMRFRPSDASGYGEGEQLQAAIWRRSSNCH